MFDNSKRHSILAAAIGFALLIVSVALTIVWGSVSVSGILAKQLYQELEDVGEQNARSINIQAHSTHILLDAFSNELQSMPGTLESNLESLHPLVQSSGLIRLGVILNNGSSFTSDGKFGDLSSRVFYMEGIKGKNGITFLNNDMINHTSDKLIVFSEPIQLTGKKDLSVVYVSYPADSMNSMLQISSFDGMGTTFCINQDGYILSSSGANNTLIPGSKLRDYLMVNSKDLNTEALEKIDNLIYSQGEISSVQGVMYLGGEKMLFHCRTILLMNDEVPWYAFTAIPESFLENRVAKIRSILLWMVIIVFVLLIITAVVFYYYLRKSQRSLRQSVYQDQLTGGFNFQAFRRLMSMQRNTAGIIVALDIVGFKNVNLIAGEATGDEVLKSVWKIVFETTSISCRFSGDNYVLFFPHATQQDVIRSLHTLNTKIRALPDTLPIPVLRVCCGIYTMKNGESATDAYSKARMAMEQAKKNPDYFYFVYDERIRLQKEHEQLLEEHFAQALKNKNIQIWLQPKISCKSGALTGAEALARWVADNGSIIPPGQFIPLLERSGDITMLDTYMFRYTCELQKKWQDAGIPIVPISVNLSRATLYQENLPERYKAILDEIGLDPKYIQIEITESVIAFREQVDYFAQRMKEYGIKVLMDDFGSGYSTLSALNSSGFDHIKLDKSLVDQIGCGNGTTMIHHLIQMAHSMGMMVTAEGVESEEQVKCLKASGCDDIQGFFYSRPIPNDVFMSTFIRVNM